MLVFLKLLFQLENITNKTGSKLRVAKKTSKLLLHLAPRQTWNVLPLLDKLGKSLLGEESIVLQQESPEEIQQIINTHQADMLISDLPTLPIVPLDRENEDILIVVDCD